MIIQGGEVQGGTLLVRVGIHVGVALLYQDSGCFKVAVMCGMM
jgi:hypothetical protein